MDCVSALKASVIDFGKGLRMIVPCPSSESRYALVEHAARHAADHPDLSALALIAEFRLSVAEAHAAMQRAGEMRVCRRAFA